MESAETKQENSNFAGIGYFRRQTDKFENIYWAVVPKLTEFNELCQSWMVVRDTPSLEVDTSSDEVIKMKFPSPSIECL